MTREKEIEILMADKCTKSDAERHLKNGAIIFEYLKERFDEYAKEWQLDEEERKKFKKMIENGVPVQDWGVAELDGKMYFIEYCL